MKQVCKYLLVVLLAQCGQKRSPALYILRLADAAGPGLKIEVLIEQMGSGTEKTLAVIPGASMKPHELQVRTFSVQKDSLYADLNVRVEPDHWFPRDGKARSGPVTINAKLQDGLISGVYSSAVFESAQYGAVAGEVSVKDDHEISGRYKVVLDHGMDGGSDKWDNRVFLDFTLDSGRIYASRIYSENNVTYAIFTSRVLSSSVFMQEDSLAVGVASLTRGAFGNGKYDFYLKGRVLGGYYYGRYVTVFEGDTVAGDRFLGKHNIVRDLPDPANAVCHIQLYDVLPKKYGAEAMWLHFNCRDGACTDGIAFAPRYNHEGYYADVSGLHLEGGQLNGQVHVSVIPDPYAQDIEDTLLCRFDINADIDKDGIRGVCSGQVGAVQVEGAVTGQIWSAPSEVPPAYRVQLKMEEGVTGAEPWFNRSYIHLRIEGSDIAEGKFTNNKEGWTGSFEGGAWHFNGNRWGANLNCMVVEGKPKTGLYSYRMEGHAVGNILMGDYTSWFRGARLDSRRVVGTIDGDFH